MRYQKSYNPHAPSAPPFPPPQPPVTLPVYTTFTLPDEVCSSIITQPATTGADFISQVSNHTASAWTRLYPSVAIAAGDVDTEIYAFRCTSLLATKPRLPQPNTVTTHSFCYLPNGVTHQQVAIASASFIEATTQNFVRGVLPTLYNVTKAQVTTHPSFSLTFCTGIVGSNATACQGGVNNTIALWSVPWIPTTSAGRK